MSYIVGKISQSFTHFFIVSKLTAITVFQNRAADVESNLTALYEHHDLPLELIIINDGSSDETGRIIQSVVEYFQHDDTYYFEHETPYGYGRSLNEALLNATGDIIWVPGNLEEIDLEKMSSIIDHLSQFPYAGASVITPDVESLGITGDVGPLPSDQSFFWNWRVIPPKERYFNTAMEHGFAYELWMRIGRPRLWKSAINLYKGDTKQNFLDLTRHERNELRFALLRGGADNRDQARIVEQQIEYIPRTINVLEIDSDKQEESAEHLQLIEKAKQALAEGNYSVSLDAVERILREDPLHRKALTMKITLLERMRRYVEASELKYTLKAAGGPVIDEPIAPEKSEAQEPEDETDVLEETDEFLTEAEHEEVLREETEAESEKEEDEDDAEPVIEETEKQQPDPELESGENDQSVRDEVEIDTTVIIPVAGTPKVRLERCLQSLHEFESPSGIELIIIDNATLDETHDYLDQLQSDGFFHCRVISNPQNVGFAKAVNQGIDEATGSYICVMHDDLELQMPLLVRLKKLLIENEDYDAVAPVTDYSLDMDQAAEKGEPGRSKELIEIEYLDSYCMMFRSGSTRFDETFGAAFFEDIDFSFQIRENGWKVGITPGLWVRHHFGSTTTELGIPAKSPRYWENAEYFHKKWNMAISFPPESENADDIEKLLLLNELINPYFPEPHLKELFDNLFTSELRTQILESNWPKDILLGLVQLMMKMEVRDVLRSLEDELKDIELSGDMLDELAYFYYRHNIFSRSRYYIDEYPGEKAPFHFKLLELEMTLAEKEVEKAVELLTMLLEENPSHPDLYRISGELHQLNGDKKEAARFFELARQLDPYRYSEKDKAIG